MQPTTDTLDLEDELAMLREEAVGEIVEEQEELLAEGRQLDPPDNEEQEDRLERIESRFDDLESQKVETEGYVNALESAIEEWGGSEIEMKEMTGQEAALLRDRVRRKAAQAAAIEGTTNAQEDVYPEGLHKVEAVKTIVESTPDGAPDPDELHALPHRLFDWLYSRANALNTVGDFEMGNQTFGDAMENGVSRGS